MNLSMTISLVAWSLAALLIVWFFRRPPDRSGGIHDETTRWRRVRGSVEVRR